jgi:hypothetical protein
MWQRMTTVIGSGDNCWWCQKLLAMVTTTIGNGDNISSQEVLADERVKDIVSL